MATIAVAGVVIVTAVGAIGAAADTTIAIARQACICVSVATDIADFTAVTGTTTVTAANKILGRGLLPTVFRSSQSEEAQLYAVGFIQHFENLSQIGDRSCRTNRGGCRDADDGCKQGTSHNCVLTSVDVNVESRTRKARLVAGESAASRSAVEAAATAV
jgi:hypothetical protein